MVPNESDRKGSTTDPCSRVLHLGALAGVGQGRAGSYLGDGGREWLAAAMMTEALNRCGFAFRVVALHGFIFMAGCVDSLTTAVAVAVGAGDVAAALAAAAAAAAARIRYTCRARAVRFINGR